ncbi:MAG: PQQ-binding-like beta-propeller repeat protein [Prolixibacteraceae bacterium]
MRQLPIYLLIVIFVLSACNPDNIIPGIDDLINTDSIPGMDDFSDDPSDDPTNEAVLWEYEDFDMAITDLVVDGKDNVYFYTKVDEEYVLSAINNKGEVNWKIALTGGSYMQNAIMLANDKIILSYDYNVLACFNTADGSEVWKTSITNFSDMAFSNGTIYLAQTITWDTQSWVTAVDVSNGDVKWEQTMDKHIATKISADQNHICFASEDQLNYPYKIGITLLTDQGDNVTIDWDFYKEYDSSDIAAKPRRASFDDQGNVFYEEGTTGSTYIYSFDVSEGTENWNTKLSDFALPDPVVLYYPGKIVASYKSDESWAIVNSTVILNSADGTVVKKNDDIVLNDNQILLTGDYSTVVFNLLKGNQPTLQIYSPTGELSVSENTDYVGWFITSIVDVRIATEGNLLIYYSDKLQCIKQDLAVPKAGTWYVRKGNNANTNSLQ